MSAPDYSLVVQGSDEWAELRCGRITASRCKDAFEILKSGKAYTAERAKYRTELLVERLTGVPYPHYVTQEMQWGLEQEPFARAAYEIQENVLVEPCGFVLHPELEFFGCSPDGLVGDDGMIQIKCPTTLTHMNWYLAGVIPLEHTFQMTAELAVTGREWCDFVSFDPRLPEPLQLFVRRFDRHEASIRALEEEVVRFHEEIESLRKALPAAPQAVAKVLEWPGEDEVQF